MMLQITGFRLAFGLPSRDLPENCEKFCGFLESINIKEKSLNVMALKKIFAIL